MAIDVSELKELVGRRIESVEYEPGDETAYLVDDKGYGHEIQVNPSEPSEEE